MRQLQLQKLHQCLGTRSRIRIIWTRAYRCFQLVGRKPLLGKRLESIERSDYSYIQPTTSRFPGLQPCFSSNPTSANLTDSMSVHYDP